MAEAETFASDEEDFKAPSKNDSSYRGRVRESDASQCQLCPNWGKPPKIIVLKIPSIVLIGPSGCLAHGGTNVIHKLRTSVHPICWNLYLDNL